MIFNAETKRLDFFFNSSVTLITIAVLFLQSNFDKTNLTSTSTFMLGQQPNMENAVYVYNTNPYFL